MAFLVNQHQNINRSNGGLSEEPSMIPYYSALESFQKYAQINNESNKIDKEMINQLTTFGYNEQHIINATESIVNKNNVNDIVDFIEEKHSTLQSNNDSKVKLQCMSSNASDIEIRSCAILSKWIYHVDHTELLSKMNDEFDYKEIIESNQSTQVAQFAFFQSNKTRTAYLIFKGTDINNPQDIITDLGMIPSALYPKNNIDKEISAHALMEVTVARDYQNILNHIKKRIQFIDKLYVTGHSLGGGLSIIFALKCIIDHHELFQFKSNDKEVKIITFGAPSVIAIEKEFDKLSLKSKEYLNILHNITYCIVNRFDIIPRILSIAGVNWIDFITKSTYKFLNNWKKEMMDQTHKYLLTQHIDKEKSPVLYKINSVKSNTIGIVGQSLVSTYKAGKENVVKMTNVVKKNRTTDLEIVLNIQLSKLLDDEFKFDKNDNENKNEEKKNDKDGDDSKKNIFGILQSIVESIKKNSKNNLSLYHPFGSYYFFLSQYESLFVCNQQNIEQILSYIPSRLSYNKQTMKFLMSNHRMKRYLKLFVNVDNDNDIKEWLDNDQDEPELFVSGYLQKIISEISNGDECGDGTAFWGKLHKKITPIGNFYFEYHLGNDKKMVNSLRQKYAKHTYKYRIRFHIYGNTKHIQIAVGNNYNELKKIYDKY